MGRAILSGSIWGVVVSGLILVAVSQQTERRTIRPAGDEAAAPLPADTGTGPQDQPPAAAPQDTATTAPASEAQAPVAPVSPVAPEPAPAPPVADDSEGRAEAAPAVHALGEPAPDSPAAPLPVAEPPASGAAPDRPEAAPRRPVPEQPTPPRSGLPQAVEAPGPDSLAGLPHPAPDGPVPDHPQPAPDQAAPVAAPAPGSGDDPAVSPAPEQAGPERAQASGVGDAPGVDGVPDVASSPSAPETAALAPAPAPPPAEPDAPRAPANPPAPSVPDAPAAPVGAGPVVFDMPVRVAAPTVARDRAEPPAQWPQLAPAAEIPVAPGAPADDPAPAPAGAPAPVVVGADAGLSALHGPSADPVRAPAPGQGAPVIVMPVAPVAPGPVPALAPSPAPPEPRVVTDRLPRIGDPTPAPETAPEAAPDTGVITGRLPRIGGAPSVPETVAETDAAEPAAALERNAVDFGNPDDLPLVALVLLDGGGPVMTLPVPFSVAIEASAADAADRAAAYAAAGAEVLILPDLPEGAQASDAAVSLQDGFARLPGAVAVMDGPDGTLQTTRDVLDQTVSELSETGHGLLTFPRGLNTAQQVAVRGGVTTALVFRDLDSEGQDAQVIRRFMDQAAFRARQENAVILVARNRPESLAAIAEWLEGNRAASVALAPVSAALRALAP